MNSATKEFIDNICNETMGFSLGDPWRISDSSVVCIVPITRHTDQEQVYEVSSRAKDSLIIEDTGNIDVAIIHNNGDLPIFFRLGEILSGSTQERSLKFSRVVPRKSTIKADIVCVHASRPISSGAVFKTSGYAPGREAFNMSAMYIDGNINQSESWNRDAKYIEKLKASPSLKREVSHALDLDALKSDDLSTARDAIKNALDDVIKKVPLFDAQVGMVLIDTSGVSLLECFDIPLSWSDVREAIVGKEADRLMEKDESGVFEFRPEKAKELIRTMLSSSYDEKIINDDGHTRIVVLDGETHTGEVVVIGDQVIHLLFARKE